MLRITVTAAAASFALFGALASQAAPSTSRPSTAATAFRSSLGSSIP